MFYTVLPNTHVQAISNFSWSLSFPFFLSLSLTIGNLKLLKTSIAYWCYCLHSFVALVSKISTLFFLHNNAGIFSLYFLLEHFIFFLQRYILKHCYHSFLTMYFCYSSNYFYCLKHCENKYPHPSTWDSMVRHVCNGIIYFIQ